MFRIVSHRAAGFVFKHPAFWRFISRFPALRDLINGWFINATVESTPPRPYPFTLWSPQAAPASYEPPNPTPPAEVTDYVSWAGLVDRSYTGRHLPPDETVRDLPPVGRLAPLFARQALIPSANTSVLFCFFAQWFTDSFLRTSATDSRRNTSNHEIDLCQIYGLDAPTAALLRQGQGGRLAMRETARGPLLSLLYDRSGQPNPPFAALPYVPTLDALIGATSPFALEPARRALTYATGLERGNSTVFYTSISTIFAREHNRLCAEIGKANPSWDDDRLFAIARNVNTAMLLRIIIEEYINHLAGAKFKVFVERKFAGRQTWYRTNRICLEFDLLYRWHSLVPDAIAFDGAELDGKGFRYNNVLVEQHGPEALIAAASRQRAGRIGLFNTPSFLRPIELLSVEFGRMFKLQPFNAYRAHFSMPPYASFAQLAGDPRTAEMLAGLYRSVDDVDLVVGLLAEDRYTGAALGDLMRTMVGCDAFSQALTNPLLADNIYGDAAFSETGLEIMDETRIFEDIVRRNAQPGAPVRARFADFA